MPRFTAVLLLATTITAPALAAPPPSSGGGTGKVSMQDLHFSSRADATAACDKAPITTAADGSFVCSVPSSSAMAINEKGNAGTKPTPSKPQ